MLPIVRISSSLVEELDLLTEKLFNLIDFGLKDENIIFTLTLSDLEKLEQLSERIKKGVEKIAENAIDFRGF